MGIYTYVQSLIMIILHQCVLVTFMTIIIVSYNKHVINIIIIIIQMCIIKLPKVTLNFLWWISWHNMCFNIFINVDMLVYHIITQLLLMHRHGTFKVPWRSLANSSVCYTAAMTRWWEWLLEASSFCLLFFCLLLCWMMLSVSWAAKCWMVRWLVSDELEMIWKKWSQWDLSAIMTFAWRDWENNKKLRVAGIMVKIWIGCPIPLQLSPTYVYQSSELINTKDYYTSSSCEQNGHMTKGSISILLEGGNITAQEVCGCVNHGTLSAVSEYSVLTLKW